MEIHRKDIAWRAFVAHSIKHLFPSTSLITRFMISNYKYMIPMIYPWWDSIFCSYNLCKWNNREILAPIGYIVRQMSEQTAERKDLENCAVPLYSTLVSPIKQLESLRCLVYFKFKFRYVETFLPRRNDCSRKSRLTISEMFHFYSQCFISCTFRYIYM